MNRGLLWYTEKGRLAKMEWTKLVSLHCVCLCVTMGEMLLLEGWHVHESDLFDWFQEDG